MKPKLALVLLFFSFVFFLSGQTYISGTISTSQTWNWEGSPYIITGTVYIQGGSNPVVTLLPRTEVRFNAGAEIQIGHVNSSSLRGGMVAAGGVTYPVRFTANSDTPSPGFWKHIKTNNYTVDGQLSFDRVTFEYGGSVNGIFDVAGSAPQFSNCVFRHSQKMGLYHSSASASATVSDCYFQNNGTYPLNWNQNYLYNLGSGCSYTNNNTQRILIVSQNVTTPQTWSNQGIPYEPENDITVYTGITPLVIASGTTIAFRTGKRLILSHQSSSSFIGCLQADGVIFTGVSETPGSWVGIVVNRYTQLDQTYIINSTISYAGASYSGLNAAINVNSYAGLTIS